VSPGFGLAEASSFTSLCRAQQSVLRGRVLTGLVDRTRGRPCKAR